MHSGTWTANYHSDQLPETQWIVYSVELTFPNDLMQSQQSIQYMDINTV